jgi:hypothetical protein
MQSYSSSPDKEAHLRAMFIDIFAEKTADSIEPYVQAIGKEFLENFYQYVWYRLKQPSIDAIGKRYFLELCNDNQQIYLIKTYKDTLMSTYNELNDLHNELLLRFIPDDLPEEHQEKLAIFESNLISAASSNDVVIDHPREAV